MWKWRPDRGKYLGGVEQKPRRRNRMRKCDDQKITLSESRYKKKKM